MFEDFIRRENTIFNALKELINAKLYFIVVGGYGVSSYKHRFSIDADIVIKKEDKNKFEEILRKLKFVKTIFKELDHVYAPEFVRYETKEKLPVSIDLLVGGVGSRATNASFSIEELKNYSERRKIIGTEEEIIAIVPKKEALIALKLHSGRLTDFRDVVALSKDIDIELINKLIWRGNIDLVKNNVRKLLSLIDKKEFIDSFKGVFIEKKYDIDIREVRKLKHLLA